ncbi:MAG: helix-turn-helix domain-containing protein [Paludibacterium sp.]|uniref:helix-turn-helix domain-containing protein n=1 Tax=Paludibacterium sp. TaxID=1917523 RepID=UPI0025E7D23F|nr:helix-turn-helix domain-containing protein [Paludibacterium sp.]MBV8049212.1 helix-turn-helix domain-containing protein [Paludibacterium sp.]MBV8647651.1 helix-turn-helix domain-containing protein [Paludibacterium sp.]
MPPCPPTQEASMPAVWRLSATHLLHLSPLHSAAELALSADGTIQRYRIASGQHHLFVACAGEIRTLSGRLIALRRSVLPVCRLLAFIEHGATKPSATAGDGAPGVLSLPLSAMSSAQAFDAWFIHMWLFGLEPAFLRLLDRLRKLESYWLIRYLLSDAVQQRSLGALAQDYGVSLAHFRRLCNEALGQSAKSARMAWRARRAMLDAILSGETLTCVAIRHGFASSSHYSNEIRRQFGLSPRVLAGR